MIYTYLLYFKYWILAIHAFINDYLILLNSFIYSLNLITNHGIELNIRHKLEWYHLFNE